MSFRERERQGERGKEGQIKREGGREGEVLRENGEWDMQNMCVSVCFLFLYFIEVD